ncbi:hypothetical protein GALL_274470 [mine drainage metagenome]|uniref:Uncharacterized protein n=1 Tax=mine drainage metagenome TaxID=410659 RepID=A0A1J5RF74_9ZZZZ
MQHDIISIISSVPFLIAVVLSTIAGAFYFWLRGDSFRFTCFAYKRAWVFGNDHRGEFQRLSKESSDSLVGEGGFVQAEHTLCQTFKAVIAGSDSAEVTKEQFERAKNYLKITQQNDIRPPSMIARIGLFVLILAESVGTGYVLAPWMSTEITPSQANLAAGVLALAVAIVLALLTHVTGAEMAKMSAYRKNSGSEGLEKRIDLGDDQEQDTYYIDPNSNAVMQNPSPRRFANRVDDPGSKGMVLLGVSSVIVVAIMVAIFFIRMGGIESQTTRQIVSMEQNGINGGSNPFASAASEPVPPDVASAQQQTRKQVAETLGGDYRTQGMAASLMLALIYLVTQFTAFIVAYKTTFSGQGESAFNFTRNQPSYETFRAKFLLPRISRAESFLTQLRQARRKRNHRCGSGKFEDYLRQGEERERGARVGAIDKAVADISNGKNDDDRSLRWELAVKNYSFSSEEQTLLVEKCEEAAHKRERLLKPRAAAQPVPSAVSVIAPAPAPAMAPASIEVLAGKFLGLSDKVERAAFLQAQERDLGEAGFVDLKAEIKRQKAQADLVRAQDKYADLLAD